MNRTSCITALFVLVAAFAFANGVEEESTEGVGGTITLYTSETLTDVQLYAQQFERLNPGTTVDIFRLGTTELVARLLAEMEAGSPGADVIWFADMALFEDFAANGDLLQIDPPEAANIPEQYVYFDGSAYETRLIYQVIAYNTNLIPDGIDGWSDLIDPQWRGRVGSASPFTSGATLTQAATLANDPDFGWDYYRDLAANEVYMGGGNGGIATKVATGEFALGLTIDFMARAQMAQGAPVDYVYQSEGSLYVPTPIGVMSATDNPALAEAFVNYLMSVPGQLQQAARGYLPVNRNVALPDGMTPADEIDVLTTDWQYLRENREEILSTFAEIFGIN
ncbi:MAG: extracellular solute-binding protein [Spirochaetota bacterium]